MPHSPPQAILPAHAACLEDTQLLTCIRDAVEIVDRCLSAGEPGERALAQTPSSDRSARLLRLLRELLEGDDPCLVPRLDARAPLAHAIPRVDELLGLAAGAGLDVLEQLADLGLLSRDLHNLVHLCPDCNAWKLNFREVCPACRDIDLRVEPMLQHFRCAFVGLDSEFRHGLELICPRCSGSLAQLGHDYERPHDTWVCNACAHLFEEPLVEVQCLDCGAQRPAGGIEPKPVYRYRPTAMAVRAVESGRLTGIELEELLCDRRAGLDSREFLRLEVSREVARLRRHGGVFSVAVLEFVADERTCAVFDRWPQETRRGLGRVLAGLRSPLDLVARIDAGRVALLLPATGEEDARRTGERLLAELEGADLALDDGRGHGAIQPRWRQASWRERECREADVLAFLGVERGGT